VLGDVTLHDDVSEFWGTKIVLLPCVVITRPGPRAVTFGGTVPNQNRSKAIKAKNANLANVLNLLLI
jgi:hypothetical protein